MQLALLGSEDLWLINCVTSVRVDAETEKLGLDARLLGEAAYSEDR
jgi:Amt family ammonium transporter